GDGPSLPEVMVDEFRLALLSPVWPPTKAGDPALTIEAALNGIDGTLPEGSTRLPLGDMAQGIERFHTIFTLTGPLPQGVYASALGQWRDQGGAVSLDDLLVDLGDVTVAGTGNATLDAALQPAVNLDMMVEGHQVLVARLVAEGTIPQLMADFANQMLKPLVTTDDTGRETLGITVGLRDRWLMIGPMQLMRLPPIQWTGSQ
ncbi:MAG: DUF2125 domain-containing protein, partial [Pseudomonadota bacterium]